MPDLTPPITLNGILMYVKLTFNRNIKIGSLPHMYVH